MAAIPHDVRPANFKKAPKGKIPYIKLADDYMGDSQLVIEKLETLRDGTMDAALSAEQRAVGHCIRRMLDEAFYFVIIHLRWNSEHTSTHQRSEFVKVLPKPLRLMYPLIVRSVRKKLHSQGTGRHTHEEVMEFGKADVRALSALLGDKAFILGDQPSTTDASVFAFLSALLTFPGDSAVKAAAAATPNLVAYFDRLRAAYWKDLAA